MIQLEEHAAEQERSVNNMRQSLFILAGIAAICLASESYAVTPFYVGVMGGYGRTTWEGLVPPEDKKNFAMSVTTPKFVSEGGALWGLLVGYEFFPSFALELAYARYPNAKVVFDENSIFTYYNDGDNEFTTRTESVSLMAKVMLTIPKTKVRAYSGLGVAEVHRSDPLRDKWITSPTFGAGFIYDFTEHIMSELGGSYTAGYGQSQLNPADDYYPFLYSIFIKIAYRI